MPRLSAGPFFGEAGPPRPCMGSIAGAAIFRPRPRERDAAVVLACFSAGDLGADAGLELRPGLVQLPPEVVDAGFGRALLRDPVGFAEQGCLHDWGSVMLVDVAVDRLLSL